MPVKVVVDSTPLASHSPLIDSSVRASNPRDSRLTHISLKFNEFKTTAVHFEDLLALLLLLGLVGLGPTNNGGSVGFLCGC
jgi:hypothetical protein